MKKYGHIIIGASLIVLAVLVVLGTVFLPRLAAKSDMKELLLQAAAKDAQYVMLVDPAYVHPGVLAGEGREVALTGEVLESVRTSLTRLADGFSYQGKGNAISGAFGLHLMVKGSGAEVAKIYFSESSFYTVLKGSAHHFIPKDMQAYTAFYNALQNAFA